MSKVKEGQKGLVEDDNAPLTIRYWFNVYNTSGMLRLGIAHLTEEDAKDRATLSIVGRMKVDVVEGVFDTDVDTSC